MANCCTETPCNKLVTVGDLNVIVSAASLDNCSNYNSGGSKTFNACCVGETSGYSPTYKELTANTGSIHFQNWSGQTTNEWFKDKDGFIVEDPQWSINGCCTGNENVPISGVSFEYTTYNGFTVSDVNAGSCASTGISKFKYHLIRHKVSGCSISEITKKDVETKILTNVDATGEETLFISGWANIISAISISDSVVPSSFINFEDFISSGGSMTLNNVKIDYTDIFQPIFPNLGEVIAIDCSGITATSNASNAYVHIIPKFRMCEGDKTYYHVSKDGGIRESFTWEYPMSDEYYDCSQHIISNFGASIKIGTARSNKADVDDYYIIHDVIYQGINGTLYTGGSENGETIYFGYNSSDNTINASIDGHDYFSIQISDTEYSIQMNIFGNQQPYDLKFRLCIGLGNCGESNETCCTICQSGYIQAEKSIPCCNGSISLYPTFDCSVTRTEAEQMAKNV